jgi:hypothetical protein
MFDPNGRNQWEMPLEYVDIREIRNAACAALREGRDWVLLPSDTIKAINELIENYTIPEITTAQLANFLNVFDGIPRGEYEFNETEFDKQHASITDLNSKLKEIIGFSEHMQVQSLKIEELSRKIGSIANFDSI